MLEEQSVVKKARRKFLFLSVKRLFELLCYLKISIISWTIFHLQLTFVIKFPVLWFGVSIMYVSSSSFFLYILIEDVLSFPYFD